MISKLSIRCNDGMALLLICILIQNIHGFVIHPKRSVSISSPFWKTRTAGSSSYVKTKKLKRKISFSFYHFDRSHNLLDSLSSDHEIDSPLLMESQKLKFRKMELGWCTRDTGCLVEPTLREAVTGPNNHISFDRPATGQVTYNWCNDDEKTEKKIRNPTVLLLVKKDDDELLKVAASTVRSLTSNNERNIDVLLFPECAAKLKYYHGVDDDKHIQLYEMKPTIGYGSDALYLDTKMTSKETNMTFPDLICTLGGDGLLMYASSLFPGPVPPILCIAGGSLGFLTPFAKDEMVRAIQLALGLCESEDEIINPKITLDEPAAIINGANSNMYHDNYDNHKKIAFSNFGICLTMRMRLDCSVVNREGVVRARYNVLNEVVIDRGSSPFLSNLECFCDNVHLTTVQADGIIFSTPTGSTAYSMAAGGSVVHPAVPCILVTPICPHVLSFRSMVFPDHVVLRCYVPDDARSGACVAFDGKNRRELHKGDSVQISMNIHPVPTINRVDHSADWLDSLKRNFLFNARPVQKPF